MPDEAEIREEAWLPDTVVADPDGTESDGTLLPLGTVTSVLGDIGGIAGEGLIDGVFKTPPIGGGMEDSEALDTLTGIGGTDAAGGREVNPEIRGSGREGLDGKPAGGEIVDAGMEDGDPDGVMTARTGSELDEVDDPDIGIVTGPVGIEELEATTTGTFEEEVGSEKGGPVGGPVGGDVGGEEEDGPPVVTLSGTVAGPELEELPTGELVVKDELLLIVTTAGPELEERPVVELLEEDVLFVLMLTGSMTALGLEEDELGRVIGGVVGVVLDEFEVIIPQAEIVEVEVSQDETVPSSSSILVTQDTSVAIHELVLTVTDGVVITPQPDIIEVEVSQNVIFVSSSLSIDVMQDTSVAIHELVLTVTDGVVVTPQPEIVEVEVSQNVIFVSSSLSIDVMQDTSVAIHELVLTVTEGVGVLDEFEEVVEPQPSIVV